MSIWQIPKGRLSQYGEKKMNIGNLTIPNCHQIIWSESFYAPVLTDYSYSFMEGQLWALQNCSRCHALTHLPKNDPCFTEEKAEAEKNPTTGQRYMPANKNTDNKNKTLN